MRITMTWNSERHEGRVTARTGLAKETTLEEAGRAGFDTVDLWRYEGRKNHKLMDATLADLLSCVQDISRGDHD